VRAIRRFTVRVTLPEPLAPLHDLMLNLRWSWHEPTASLFESIDPVTWRKSGGDPNAMLGTLPPERLAELAADPEFGARLREAADDLRQYLSSPGWFSGIGQAPAAIAYFSPEYGITAALPQY
jgi:starch phosphorylase